MALKKASSAKKVVKKTAAKKAAPAKRLTTRKPVKAARPKVAKTVAKSVEKRAVAPPAPRPTRPEPPAVDHGMKIAPLFLGAGHGYLSRAVDKQWLDALDRYRQAVAEATAYESKRSPQARAALVLNFGRQLQTMMQNLTTRISALAQESALLEASMKDAAHKSARLLVEQLFAMNNVLGEMVGSKGIAPLGDASIPSGNLQQLDQMHRAHTNNIARISDLERTVS